MNKIRNEKGFTLIELVIVIGVLVILAFAVSSMVIHVANNYKRSTSQTIISSEAQNTTNQLKQMIMDATDTVAYLYAVSEGVFMPVEGESDIPSGFEETDRRLEITKGNVVKVITFNNKDNTLTYQEESDGDIEDYGLLAEYVSDFEADVSDYEESRTVSFKIIFTYENTNYETAFSATSRNEVASEANELIENPHFKVSPKEICLEPNQDYTVACRLLGGQGSSKGKYNLTLMEATDMHTSVSSQGSSISIHIGNNETGNSSGELYILLNSVAKNDDGTPKATALVTIKIRRVTGINAALTLLSGEEGKRGAEYLVTAKIAGTNLSKAVGMDYDADYINPVKVVWETRYRIGVTEKSEAGVFEKVDSSLEDNLYYRFRLLKDLDLDSKYEITVKALHSSGTNKTGIKYAEHEKSVWLIRNFEVISLDNIRDGFNRGDDFYDDFFIGDITTILDKYYPRDFMNTHSHNGHYFYRFREISYGGYGEWNEYRATDEGGTTLFLRSRETARLEIDKYYEVQIIYAVLDQCNSKGHILYYPIDSSLVDTPGTGFTGFTKGWEIKGGAFSTALTPSAEYSVTFLVAPARMQFGLNNADTGWKTIYFDGMANEDNPWGLESGWEMRVYYRNKFFGLGRVGSLPQSLLKYRVEKKVNGSWIALSANKPFKYIQVSNQDIYIKNGNEPWNNYMPNDKGIYRELFYLQDYPLYSSGTSLFDTNYQVIGYKNYDLYYDGYNWGALVIEIR